MQEHHSILYGPVNALWHRLGGHVEVPDHLVMSFFVVTLLLAIFIPVGLSLREEAPSRFQVFLEQLVGGLRGMIEAQVGHGAGDRYLALIGAFTLFIFTSNVMGLFFFLNPPTANVNVTFGLAGISFVLYNAIGIRKHGVHYIKHFLGPIWWLTPLFFVIELISHAARWLSLGLRLFGNMTGEHMVSGVFNRLVPLLAPLPIMALGLFAAVIQTFIFIMLTTVYIAGAEAEEH
ncbi:MAG TPA: F0F1 ATP synthase subunit A [Thermoanaerobaculia bacterium]|jgi:F-type H+-transporting ATPase subunit a|nr:F0F1 ATP synthase subunit A [Thermoanaerobaculia bacterium]